MAIKTNELAPIEPGTCYPREVLCRISGLGVSALRKGARDGELRQHFVSGRCFILGRDFIGWVQNCGKDRKDALISQECFRCGEPATGYIEAGQWAGQHACSDCFQSLSDREQNR